jgi:hypothetical protein
MNRIGVIRLTWGIGALLTALPAHAGPVPTTARTVDEALAPWGKALADVDGDGRLDVVVGGGYVLDGLVYWYRYGESIRNLIGEAPASDDGYMDTVSTGDINGDGAPDVVASKGIYWFENPRGHGGDPRQPWTIHLVDRDYAVHDIRVADMNRDGRADILARNTAFESGEPGSKLYLQGASDTWTAVTLANVPLGQGIAIGDINRDGRLDIAVGAMWFEQPLDPVADEWSQHDFAPTREPTGQIALGDMNLDGRTDIVFIENVPWPTELTWFEAPPDPVNGVWTPHDLAVLEDVHSLLLADMDGNGWLDIVTAEEQQSEQKRVAIYFSDSAASSWTEQILGTDGSHNMVVGDLERDGDMDILGANWVPFETDGGAIMLWINQSDTDGDGVSEFDNCTTVANPDQRDTNGDGFGNRCDGDLDQSNNVNAADLAIYKTRFGTTNADADLDGNGNVNAADLAIFKTLFGKAPGPSGLVP